MNDLIEKQAEYILVLSKTLKDIKSLSDEKNKLIEELNKNLEACKQSNQKNHDAYVNAFADFKQASEEVIEWRKEYETFAKVNEKLEEENNQLKEQLATKNSANIVLRGTYQGALREIAELKERIKQLKK